MQRFPFKEYGVLRERRDGLPFQRPLSFYPNFLQTHTYTNSRTAAGQVRRASWENYRANSQEQREQVNIALLTLIFLRTDQLSRLVHKKLEMKNKYL